MTNKDDQITPRQQHAWDLYQHAVKLVKQQSVLLFDIGQTFKEIRDEKMWQHMCEGGFESWEQFLSQPDIYLAPQTVRAYIYIYEIYIEKLGLDKEKLTEIPFYKLNMLASFIKNLEPEKALDVLDALKELGANDFNTELNILKGKDTPDIQSKSEREEDDLEEIFNNMYEALMKAKDTDAMKVVLSDFRSIVLKWHKKFKM